ncbi:glycine betaine ABC transporter substrate-binding protein [Kamptonema formosum]|uniref:glycine betaine ABC transporter substrate-binding protein n=1 Tax=Kamptonema formosum TaxID=331992 RepID=UPI0003812E42|nr:glycine betaine ABC transporter substrate-binding protein [Oscillatoria sp. PCC 10802]
MTVRFPFLPPKLNHIAPSLWLEATWRRLRLPINKLFLILTFALTVAVAGCSGNSLSGGGGDIVIGSKNFTEQFILGELLAQHIEATAGLKVDRRLNLGGTFICHTALAAGQLDAYVEYTGTSFTAILKQKPISDPKAVYQKVRQEYAKQFGLEVTEPLGFENTFAMAVRGSDARRLNIQTLSQAAQYTPQWQAGFGYEFIEREDGFTGLSKTYAFKFAKPPKIMDLGLMYRALVDKKVDLVAGNSTDGQIARLGLTILKDDKQYFPPYEAVPVVRQETLKKYPQLRKAFQQLGGAISAEEMQRMNYQVDGEFRKVEDVVREFLQSKGLLNKAKGEPSELSPASGGK